MKLRIRANTIRLRLGREDLRRLVEEGRVGDVLQFGPGEEMMLSYGVEAASDISGFDCRYRPGEITVRMADELCRRLSDSDDVGFEEEIDIGEGMTLSLSVEKDFACLKPRDPSEDEGTFPHPDAVAD